MTFPTPYTVTRLPFTGESTYDSTGEEIPVWGDPVELPVYSIAPHLIEQGSTTVTETQVADVDVAMPKALVELKDRFEFDGDTYEVVGVQDWTRGFHGWAPGIVVELRKVT
ncbi:head-tail adaptor [Mycobacterium phage TChen]|uniref:Head-to-tail stopper n=3 Tax=Thetabobvirus TaxID=2843467 RepID=A0A385DZI8_9CAUD|nr:head-tail adaptor [Mycobacterium phage TChen]YP_009841034.1 head-tail adaptor [Mycobacterium phage Renaud18]YP_009848828.1 head-tail adaptor [Mycobacterium phage ThetaBob]UCR74385.1 hypothetical protein Saroj_9 [Mycobacterium phage Saroj]UZV39535.1 head to tail stopper [Mycobacterium phage Ritam007]AWH14410.1 head-to-tail stopper [Mycobacterium phage TChen]AXQ64920.1 head-to-tail stopper [Mycobacterium phage Renaud18]QDF19896.1 head-to-tail connector complex protein [Mycobacterium phage T